MNSRPGSGGIDPLARGHARLRHEHADHLDRRQGKALALVGFHRHVGDLLVREHLVGPHVAPADDQLQIVERLLVGHHLHHAVVARLVPAPDTHVGVRRQVAHEGQLRPRSAPGGIGCVAQQQEVAAEAAVERGGDGGMTDPCGQVAVQVALQSGELVRGHGFLAPAVAVRHDHRERRAKLVLLAPVLDEAALQAGGGVDRHGGRQPGHQHQSDEQGAEQAPVARHPLQRDPQDGKGVEQHRGRGQAAFAPRPDAPVVQRGRGRGCRWKAALVTATGGAAHLPITSWPGSKPVRISTWVSVRTPTRTSTSRRSSPSSTRT